MREELEPVDYTRAYGSIATQLKDTLTPAEASYLAGLLDGEGSIYLRAHRKQDGKQHLEATVTIGVTHPMIIDLANKYGGLWYDYESGKEKTKSGEPYKPFYVWEWQHPMIKLYFPYLLPYLRIKREQGEIIIKVIETATKRKRTARTDEDRDFFRKAQRRLYYLNHKPYPCDTSKYEHLKIYKSDKNPKCPKCNSHTWKSGRTKQDKRFKCANCGYLFRIVVQD